MFCVSMFFYFCVRASMVLRGRWGELSLSEDHTRPDTAIEKHRYTKHRLPTPTHTLTILNKGKTKENKGQNVTISSLGECLIGVSIGADVTLSTRIVESCICLAGIFQPLSAFEPHATKCPFSPTVQAGWVFPQTNPRWLFITEAVRH